MIGCQKSVIVTKCHFTMAGIMFKMTESTCLGYKVVHLNSENMKKVLLNSENMTKVLLNGE